jgi:peroxiredoxin
MQKRSELRIEHPHQKRNIFIAVVSGLGLILLAAVSAIMLANPEASGISGDNLSTVPAEVNYPAPQLTLENISGKTEALADFRDKVVLVNNWATWCPPCKAEMPTLVAFYNEHQSDGLMIIAIEAGEAKDQVQRFAEQYQMPFAVWLDPQGKAVNAFKNQSLPSSYVIDRSGIVRLMWTGEINREALEKYVTPLLAEN